MGYGPFIIATTGPLPRGIINAYSQPFVVLRECTRKEWKASVKDWAHTQDAPFPRRRWTHFYEVHTD